MNKTPLVLTISAGLILAGATIACNGNNGNNSPSKDLSLKQSIRIDETGQGNTIALNKAEITAISFSGTSTPNLMKVKIFGQEYRVQFSTNTNATPHYRGFWGETDLSLSQFAVGNFVNVQGTLDSADFFLIQAKSVHNVSGQKNQSVLNGTVQNIVSSTNSFSLQTKKSGTLTVDTVSSTKIYQGKDQKAFSDLQTGMKVSVGGIWDKTLAKVQALLIRIKTNKASNH